MEKDLLLKPHILRRLKLQLWNDLSTAVISKVLSVPTLDLYLVK